MLNLFALSKCTNRHLVKDAIGNYKLLFLVSSYMCVKNLSTNQVHKKERQISKLCNILCTAKESKQTRNSVHQKYIYQFILIEKYSCSISLSLSQITYTHLASARVRTRHHSTRTLILLKIPAHFLSGIFFHTFREMLECAT